MCGFVNVRIERESHRNERDITATDWFVLQLGISGVRCERESFLSRIFLMNHETGLNRFKQSSRQQLEIHSLHRESLFDNNHFQIVV